MQIQPPEIVGRAWQAFGDGRAIVDATEVSANVSTNQVFRLQLSDGSAVIVKVSSYGSYFLFREDHERIRLWLDRLQRTRYRRLLAPVLVKDGRVFVHREDRMWAVFYGAAPEKDKLPRRLDTDQIVNLAEEIAYFHKECRIVAQDIPVTSKSIKSDIINLLDLLGDPRFSERFELEPDYIRLLKNQCETFLNALEELGYDYMFRIPLLIDWNIGNFSIEAHGGGFRLFSRWDYDWFRIAPPGLDFYFFSRVTSDVGDRTEFSYFPDTLLEPRFRIFLQAYSAINPLSREELLFLKEAYRFFVLHYVMRMGEHFFKASICRRLRHEALEIYLPRLDQLDFRSLFDAIAD